MISADIEAALARVDHEMNRIETLHAIDRQHIKAFDAFKTALAPEPVLNWFMQIPSERVGVHMKNRGGIGVVHSKAVSLGSANCENGYSIAMASKDAVASSTWSRDGGVIAEWEKFNDALNARQALPPLVAAMAISLGSGHGNAWLRIVNDKQACAIKSVAPSGYLDPNELAVKYPGIAEPLAKGLNWHVIHWAVFNRYKCMADICQKALNSKNMQVVTEVEGLVTMASLSPAPWQQIKEGATQSKPFWEPWAHQMLAVAEYTNVELINEMGNIVASLVYIHEVG